MLTVIRAQAALLFKQGGVKCRRLMEIGTVEALDVFAMQRVPKKSVWQCRD